MNEPTEKTDLDRIADEFRRNAGPLEYLVDAIQDGIEIEAFSASPAGKILIGRACQSARAAMEVLLDPNSSTERVMVSVQELRVQHRVLQAISDAVNSGRLATQNITQSDVDDPDDTPPEEPL